MTDDQGRIETGLFGKAVKGGLWVFGFSITQEVLAIARLVILAHLLSPNDFGLAGIAILILATLDTFTQTGFDSALIQKKGDVQGYLDTAWTVGLARGVLVFGALYLLAPVGAAFFRTAEATVLIRFVAISLLARSVTSVGVVFFRRDLQFHKQFLWQFTGRLADFVIAVAVGLALRNVWALIIALVAGDVAKAVASYVLHPYRPRFRIDWAKARELFDFGKWLLGLGIIAFLLTQGDNALVGRLVGATLLGYYQLARRISNVPATEIAHVISAVTFPAYSRLQDSMSKLAQAFLMVLEVTALAALPLAGAILALAPEVVGLCFGAKWLPAAPAVRILAAWGAIGAIGATAESVLVAVGKPRSFTKYQAIQLVLLAAIIYPATLRWSIAGTSLAVVVAGVLPCWLALRQVAKVTACGARPIARMIALPAAAAAAGASAVLALKQAGLVRASEVPGFAIALAAYATIYAAIVWQAGNRFRYGLGPLFREIASALPLGRRRPTS